MSSFKWAGGARLAGLTVALAACASLDAGERHNIILFVPEVLSAASADDGQAPTLTRLRNDGVNFLESHSRFPPLAPPDTQIAADFDKDGLIEAAVGAGYMATFLQDVDVDPMVVQNLRSFAKAPGPFLLIYRLAGNTPGSADEALAPIEAALKDLGLYDVTNIIVAAEHGSSGVWKASRTSLSVALTDEEEEKNEIGQLSTGFLAIDVTAVLQKAESRMSLFDPDQAYKPLDWIAGDHPIRGNAVIGTSPTDARVVVEARGGHDFLILSQHLSKRDARDLADYIVRALFKHDYVSGVFVNEKRVGRIRGALSQEHLGWHDDRGGRPDIVVNFASVSAGCRLPMTCTFAIADTPLEEGDDIQGAFSRADTWTFTAARGPDFRAAFIDRVPASNADVSRTIRELIAAGKSSKRQWAGRVLTESLRGYEQKPLPAVGRRVVASKPAADGVVTEVILQTVGATEYFDAAGFPGWTVGIQYKDAPLGSWWQWEWPRPRSMTITISPD